MPRTCDGCTMCCTALGVPELKKGLGSPCEHCQGGGCQIYDERPGSCEGFECAWLQSTGHFPVELKPDLVGALVYVVPTSPLIFQVFPDPADPERWLDGPLHPWIKKAGMELDATVIVVVGLKRSLFWVSHQHRQEMTARGWLNEAGRIILPDFCPCGLTDATECAGECGKASGWV